MRHYNPTHTSYWHNHGHPYVCDKPYSRDYTYTRPTKKCWYIKILQYVCDHPNCKRYEILNGVFPHYFKTIDTAKKFGSGYASNTFANIIYDDLIDYDKSYRYTITEKGKTILKNFYIKELAEKILY